MKRSIFFNKIRDRRIPMVVVLLIAALLCSHKNLSGRTGGFKYFKNYSPKDYGRHSQNWCILQDRRGVIYAANQGGLLEFDGVNWRLIPIPNDSVRSMAIQDDGTIYIGGTNEIGFLKADEKGALQYFSLLKHLKTEQQNFSTVWRTHATREGIFFRTSKYLFYWNPASRQMNVLEAGEKMFYGSFVCGEKLYLSQGEVGLMQVVRDTLVPVPGGDIFADMGIATIVPYIPPSLLIGTRSNGFYRFDGNTIKPFTTEVDKYLKDMELYHGIRLSSSADGTGEYALATLQGGVVIIDSGGRLKNTLTKTLGLQDNSVKYIFEDTQGNLWLGLEKGISKIEYSSPLSIYDERSDLPGLVQTVVRHNQRLYAGTSNGLYSLAENDRFKPVPGMSSICRSILSIGDYLLVATSLGVFQLKDSPPGVPVIDRRLVNSANILLQSEYNPNRIWVGTQEGLFSLVWKEENRQWRKENTYPEINEEIFSLVEEKGNLWLGTLTKGALYLNFSETGPGQSAKVSKYNDTHGLPPGRVSVFMAAGHIIFATKKGLYRFDDQKKSFISDLTLGTEFAGIGNEVFRIAEDKDKNIWFHSMEKNFQAAPRTGGSLTLLPTPFQRIPPAQVNAIYPDPEGTFIWFAGHDGLIRYDISEEVKTKQVFPTLIRKVLVNGTLFFAGYNNYEDRENRKSDSVYPIFPFRDRNLHFEFAAPFYEDESSTRYRYILEGYDKAWSPLTSETQKDYTNLEAGSYTFRVKARTIYESDTDEAVFHFRILSPWYSTWWAYLIYGIIVFTLILLIVKWRSWKLIKEKESLEQIIKDRTKEIHEKNQQLENNTLQLKAQSEKLEELHKLKSRFFANISHEFRTPLTLIMGPLEQIISETRDKKLKKQLNLMFRNSQRLLTLINQLLDLSKIDSGKMKLQARFQNILPTLKGIAAAFEPLTTQHNLELKLICAEENIPLYFELKKIEQIMCNLLINAVKFTPAGGKITINAETIASGDERFLELSVIDTGVGIPQDQLAHVFDRFYQSQTPMRNSAESGSEGTGIGLALTKELVELHHGGIQVESIENKGTRFTLRFPMGKEHLGPEEIAPPSETPGILQKTCEMTAPYLLEKKQDEPPDENQDNNNHAEKGAEEKYEAGEKDIILVVDDSPGIREFIRRSLEEKYRVEEANNGREGIKKAKEIIPDLIISDIVMPDVNGLELCHTLKKNIETCHIPIILLTAKAAEENIIQGLETGADDYITKPFNTMILYTRIKNLIELRRQMQLKIQRQKTLLPDEISVSSMDETFLEELQGLLEKHISEPELNIDLLCKSLYMGRTTLFRKIEALTGQTPNQFIQSYRLQRAAQLLKANIGSITQIAFKVGFSSSAYFTKCFKEKYHQLPSTFQAAEAVSPGDKDLTESLH